MRFVAVTAMVFSSGAVAVRTQGGAATIVLPRTLIAERPATLAVLDSAGALLPDVVVEFAGGVRVNTDAGGRASFTVPPLEGSLQTGLLRARVPGTDVQASALVLPPAGAENPLSLREAPRTAALTDRFGINGTGFSGAAGDTRIWLDEQEAILLAASPVEMIVTAGPQVSPGRKQLIVEIRGQRSAPLAVTLVAIELSADRASLAPKQKGVLTVRVRGTEQRLELEARNLSPDVIKLPDGNVQRLWTSGGESNSTTLRMEGRKLGEFSLSVRLIPQAAGLPDTEAALQKLLAARRMAPEGTGWGWRLTRVIEQMEKNPQNALQVRTELEKLLSLHPQGEFGKLIEAAWLILLNR